jgi:CRISPR/Cas system-associated exonuclease Cas4 (RecB family)
MKTSYSALSLYESCPRRYLLERVEQRAAPESPALLLGSAVHAAIAAYLKHLRDEGLATDITWAAQAMKAAEEALAGNGRILGGDLREEAEEIFRTFVGSHAFDPADIAEVELSEKVDLPDGVQFFGVIDLLEVRDGLAVVTDWKTDWAVRGQAEVERDFQLRAYAWMVSKLYGYEEVVCRLDFVRHPGAVREALFGPEDMARTEERILRTVESLQTDKEWRPSPGSHCSWCPWSEDCPAVSDLPVSITTSEDAKRIAGEILVLEKQLKDRKEALKAWTAVEGTVTVGGQEFGHHESRSLRVTDIPAFIALLEEAGKDPYGLLSVDGRKLSPYLRDSYIRERLEEISEEVVSTRFGARKAKEEG